MWSIGIVGFGNVGMGFAELLLRKREYLEKHYGFRYRVIGVVDKQKGSVYRREGLSLRKVLLHAKRGMMPRDYRRDMDALELIEDGTPDILVEATPTNLRNGEPALTYIKRALELGIHAVTTNKGCIVHGYKELERIASMRGVFLRFEGTVMSGTPVISLIREQLAGCEIKKIQGILNGTTNFILSEMEKGMSFSDALALARKKGYVERDESLDIDGLDSAAKAIILARILLHMDLSLERVNIQGIRSVTLEDILNARRRGKRIKLLVDIEREKEKIVVAPREIPMTNPLSRVEGSTNALLTYGDTLPRVFISGPGAGRTETGQAVLSDVLHIHRMAPRD